MNWGVGRGCRGRMYAVRYGGRSWLFGRSVSARVGLSTEVTDRGAVSSLHACARALSVIGTGGIQREVNRRSSVAVAACVSLPLLTFTGTATKIDGFNSPSPLFSNIFASRMPMLYHADRRCTERDGGHTT